MRFATRLGLQRTFNLSCSNETVVNAFLAVASKCVRCQIRPRFSSGCSVAIHAWRVLVLASLIAAPLAGQDLPSGIPESSPTNHAEESAPPLNRFGKDLAYNFGALFSKDNLRPAIIGTLVTSAAIPADRPVRDFFADMNRAGRLDAIGKQLGKSQLIGPAIGVSLLISRTTENARFQRFTYSLAQGFVVNNAVTAGIKVATQRRRPDNSDRFSFPSGHTSNSFMWATVVSREYGWKAGAPAYVLAAYVGSSRLQSRKHNLTDVIAGATLGYIIGRTVTRDPAARRPKRVNWNVVVPHGGGAAMRIGIRAW